MPTTRKTARRLALASALLAAATLTPTPAEAAVFTNAELEIRSDVHDDESCSTNPGVVANADPDQNVVENGPAVTVTASSSGSVTDGVSDTQTGASSVSATGSVTSSGTNLKGITLTAQGSVSVTNTVADSVCRIHAYSSVDLNYEFTVTQPGFLTFTRKLRGAGLNTEFLLNGEDGSAYHENFGENYAIDSTEVIYLPAGSYFGRLNATGGRATDKAGSGSGTTTLRATFSPVGSQTVAPAGKGKRYVDLLDTGRSCATDRIAASITPKSRAGLIKQVTFLVNGAKKKTVKNPDSGDPVSLTGIVDGADAEVRAVVKLVKKRNGKARKPVEVTASYEACTPAP